MARLPALRCLGDRGHESLLAPGGGVHLHLAFDCDVQLVLGQLRWRRGRLARLADPRDQASRLRFTKGQIRVLQIAGVLSRLQLKRRKRLPVMPGNDGTVVHLQRLLDRRPHFRPAHAWALQISHRPTRPRCRLLVVTSSSCWTACRRLEGARRRHNVRLAEVPVEVLVGGRFARRAGPDVVLERGGPSVASSECPLLFKAAEAVLRLLKELVIL